MISTGKTDAAEQKARAERRDQERISILGELQGEVMVFEPLAITEIARGGIQIETAFPLHIESLHELRLPLGDRPIVVKGRVTHCCIIDVDQELVRYRSGIQFTEMSERVASAVETFIQAVKDGRHST